LLRIRGSSPTVRKGVLLCGIALAPEDARKYTPSLRVGLLPRSLSQRPQERLQLSTAGMVQSKHSQLRRLTQNVRRSASNMLPRLPNAFDQKWFIGSRVGNELDAIQRHGIDELVYF